MLAGGVVSTTSSPAAAAAWSPRQLVAKDLKVGDLVVGPGASIVRVSTVRRLGSGRVVLRYTEPATGVAVAFEPATATTGHPARRPFVVLARGVAAAAVRFPAAAGPVQVVDGGSP